MLYLFIISYLGYIILKSLKNSHMLQQNFYNTSNRYIKWLNNNKQQAFFNYDWLFILIYIICLRTNWFHLSFFLLYVSLFCYYKIIYSQKQAKKPLVITTRIIRLLLTTTSFYMFFIYWLIRSDYHLLYLVLGLLASLNSLVIYFINIINKPLEKSVYFYYYYKAKTKLKQMKHLIVIGITGSYGKTSSKHILSDILNIKYNTLPTPESFNTPNGLLRTINERLDKFTEIFIAEMGACNVGEIKELCDIVKPHHGILTAIGVAHLDTFKTESNIQKTKFELIESLPKEGIAILNKDDIKQVTYKLKNKNKLLWIGIDNNEADVKATNINYSKNGTTFDCVFKKDNQTYSFETKLLGKANVYNILAGIALAKELNMTITEITRGVKAIKPIEHRLQLKKFKELTIIDDAYNSNPVGSQMALDILKLMPGFKVVVTPGMIELKDKQYSLNFDFGKQIATVADYVILVGTKQTKPIYEGLIQAGYGLDKIQVIDDVKEAFLIINNIKAQDKYVLLENDLPDIFNE